VRRFRSSRSPLLRIAASHLGKASCGLSGRNDFSLQSPKKSQSVLGYAASYGHCTGTYVRKTDGITFSLWYKSPSPRTEVILSEKLKTAQMGGEALREAGTLVLVFAPMYELFEPDKQRWDVFLLIFFVGAILLGLGIEVERRRA
jgi:hypothetical protein